MTCPRLDARVGTFDLNIQANERDSLRLDADGRWASFRSGQSFYRRLLDASVLVHADRTTLLSSAQARAVHEQAHEFAKELLLSVQSARADLRLSGTLACRNALQDRLELAAHRSADDYTRQNEKYHIAYREPVQILPPDRYLDLVLMPSYGCPSASCDFCAFYKGRRFRIASKSEFREHLLAVNELFGASIRLRDGIFLGAANALAIAQRRLLEVIDESREAFGHLRRGIASFWDPDHSPRRTLDDWHDLAKAGLHRVYTGLESGDAEIRVQLGKSSRVTAFIEAVQVCKQAGIGVGVILLLGPGAPDHTHEHRTRSCEAIKSMTLSSSDIVYISPLQGSMEPEQLKNEQRLFAAELRTLGPAKISSYCMEKFHYFA